MGCSGGECVTFGNQLQDCSQLLEKPFSLASILSRGRSKQSTDVALLMLYRVACAGLAAEKEELARQSEVKQKKATSSLFRSLCLSRLLSCRLVR